MLIANTVLCEGIQWEVWVHDAFPAKAWCMCCPNGYMGEAAWENK